MIPLLISLLFLAPAGIPGEKADLLFLHGRVHTLEIARPLAQALAVKGDRILFVGSDAEALVLKGEKTRVIDLDGRSLYPGFTDAHGHLAGLGHALLTVDLVGTRSYREVVERVARRAADRKPGEWIQGRGWDQNDWAETGFPDHRLLSAAVSRNPVAVTRIDGHALLANAAAMEAAGITAETKDPEGGRIVRDAAGNPTGVFVDAATALIRRMVPPDPPDRLREGIRLAIEELHRYGVTGIHDAGVPPATIDLYASMARAGEFDLRDYVMISASPESLDRWLPKGPVADLTGDGRITVRAIKMVADGALGSRGAALLEDYSDDPGNAGLETETREHIEGVAERALRAGFQLCVHAIGDRGNRNVLDAFEAALKKVPVADHRFRIEHAQILHPVDLPRFAELGVIPSMQAQHQTSDMYWAGRRLGPTRVLGAYAWRSLLDTGVVIPGGSDFPVERPDPLAAYHAAVSRQDARNWPAGGWHPEQRMTRAEALAHLTIWPAYASFAEDRLGSLRPGKLADLVVLSADLESTPVPELESIRVELTVFDGRPVYPDRP